VKIAMVGDSDKGGGAAIAATRLFRQLIADGHRVNRFVVRKKGDEETTWACGDVSPVKRNLLRALWHFGFREAHDRMSDMYFSDRLGAKVREFSPELVNVHNIHSAGLTVGLLPRLRSDETTPLVWTLHDMWVMTGHCAYSYDCDKFTGTCDSECPYPEEYPALRASRIEAGLALRKKIFGTMRNLAFVTPSRWLAGEAGRGILADHPVYTIPNGIDPAVFFPMAKPLAREAVVLPAEKFILLTGAASLQDKRKGLIYLIRSLREIPSPDRFLLVTFGRAGDDSFPRDFPVEVRHVGAVAQEDYLRLLYGAADAFVLPTLADNLPNVLVESIACGTPCVAFDVGGVREVVRPGETGFLARPKDPDDLAGKILELAALPPAQSAALAASCRSVAEREFSLELQAERYGKLFADLLASATRSG
jgi:glycosyltransferase involved in cell wall biosynthesis